MKNETLLLTRNLAHKNQREPTSAASYLPPPPPRKIHTQRGAPVKKLTLILITILALNLACDDDNNDGGNGDDPTNGTPNGTKTPTPATTTVDTPENLSSDEPNSTDGTYTLSWSMVDGASTYKLQERQGDNPESYTEIYSGEGLAHGVTPPKTTGSYAYQVRACDASDACSEWSDAVTVHVFRSGAPTLSSDPTSSTDGAYTLSWDAVTDAATYKLREGNTELELSPATATTHSVTGRDNRIYMYQVQACHTNGVCSEWSIPAITVHVFKSGAPTNLRSDETSSRDGTYELSWDPVTDAATYKLLEGRYGVISSLRMTSKIVLIA